MIVALGSPPGWVGYFLYWLGSNLGGGGRIPIEVFDPSGKPIAYEPC